MGTTLLAFALKLGELLIGNALDNKQMMDLFYKFVARIQSLYLKSAHLKEDATKRWAELNAKAAQGFVESP